MVHEQVLGDGQASQGSQRKLRLDPPPRKGVGDCRASQGSLSIRRRAARKSFSPSSTRDGRSESALR